MALKGAQIVSGSDDGTVKLWDLASGDLMQTLEVASGGVYSVALSADSTHIVSGSGNRTVKLWDMASGACMQTLEEHLSYVYSVAASPDGRHIVSGGADKTVKIWDARHYRRVPHVLIRSRVHATYATPGDGPLLERQLLHFVYGRNADDAAEQWPTLLADLFPLIIQFLVG